VEQSPGGNNFTSPFDGMQTEDWEVLLDDAFSDQGGYNHVLASLTTTELRRCYRKNRLRRSAPAFKDLVLKTIDAKASQNTGLLQAGNVTS